MNFGARSERHKSGRAQHMRTSRGCATRSIWRTAKEAAARHLRLAATIALAWGLIPGHAQSQTTWLTSQAAFEAAAGATEALITTAERVALAEELTEPLLRNTGVGSSLTFNRSVTHLGRSFRLQALEDGGMTFDDDEDAGNLVNFDNALSIGDLDNFEDDDWELTVTDGPPMRAFGVVIRDNSFQPGESVSILDASGQVLDTFDVSFIVGGSRDFIGVVSDRDFFGIRFDEDPSGDDMAVADFRFGVPPAIFTQVPQSAVSSLRPMLVGLNDGRVLRSGGVNGATAVVLSPMSPDFVQSVPLADSRRSQSMVALLRSGRVLLMGGNTPGVFGEARTKTNLFTPSSNAWSDSPDMINQRSSFATVRMNDGRLLVMGGFNGITSIAETEIYDPVGKVWQAASPMSGVRANFPAARLADGRILVAGGLTDGNDTTASCEIYDPATGNWSSTGAMIQSRSRHVLATLRDGRVLVAGGASSPSAEIYDPATGQWTDSPGASLRGPNGAVRLPDGRVLVGGEFTNGSASPMEIFDPIADAWSPAPELVDLERSDASNLRFIQLTDGRAMTVDFDATTWVLDNMSTTVVPAADGPLASFSSHTLMSDGRVLVAGGANGSGNPTSISRVFDPQTGQWSGELNLAEARRDHAAVLLNDGSVMITGGFSTAPTAAVEIFDPTGTGQWSFTGPLRQARNAHTANLLGDGSVVVVGGFVSGGATSSVERWDPATGIWTETPSCLAQPLSGHTATTLRDGRLLIVGGVVNSAASAAVQIYDPRSDTCNTVASLAEDRFLHTATLLEDGQVLVVGGHSAGEPRFNTEIYDPVNNLWRLGPPLGTARRDHQATMLANGMVLITGGQDRQAQALPTTEVFDPITQRWFGIQALAQARINHGATLMFDGSVFITGGSTMDTTALATTEIVRFGFSIDEADRPVISSIDASPAADDALTITGSGFSNRSESVSAMQVGDDYPTVIVRRLDNGARVVLPVNPFNGWSPNRFSASPADLLGGPSLVSVVVGGIPSDPVYLTVGPALRLFADGFEN